MLVQILRRIRDTVGWIKLPSDVQSIWRAVRDWVLPIGGAGVSGSIFHFVRDAPWWQVLGAIIIAFAALHLIQVLAPAVWRRRQETASTNPQENRSAGSGAPEPEQPRSERTGVRQRGGSGRYRNTKIRNQDVGIDAEDADIDSKDLDIK